MRGSGNVSGRPSARESAAFIKSGSLARACGNAGIVPATPPAPLAVANRERSGDKFVPTPSASRREQVIFGKATTLSLVADPILSLISGREHSSLRLFRTQVLLAINSGEATRAEFILINEFNSAKKLGAVFRFQTAG
jgi:hypothetical protein